MLTRLRAALKLIIFTHVLFVSPHVCFVFITLFITILSSVCWINYEKESPSFWMWLLWFVIDQREQRQQPGTVCGASKLLKCRDNQTHLYFRWSWYQRWGGKANNWDRLCALAEARGAAGYGEREHMGWILRGFGPPWCCGYKDSPLKTLRKCQES